MRAEGSALAGQWFLPGGAIERGELPEDGDERIESLLRHIAADLDRYLLRIA